MINYVFGIFGIIGGLLCAIGDILLDLKGKNNVKSGQPKIIDSNWLIMSEWRFRVSIFFAALGVPLFLLGFLGMANHLAQSNKTVAMTFLIFSIIGASGGLFIHALLCIMPIICKTLTNDGVKKDIIETVCNKIYYAIKIPLISIFFSLTICTSITLIYAIIKNYLNVPLIFVILNPLGLIIIGLPFRLINKRIFADLPGIIMPSMGISMIGLMTTFAAIS